MQLDYSNCFHVAALWICSGLYILRLNTCKYTHKLIGANRRSHVKHHREGHTSSPRTLRLWSMVPGGIYLHLTAYWFQAYLHRSFTALRLEFRLLSLLFLFLPLACKIKLLHIYTLCHVCKICRRVPLLEILIPEVAFSYCPSNCPLSTCNKQTKNQNTFLQRTSPLWKDIERWRIYCFF